MKFLGLKETIGFINRGDNNNNNNNNNNYNSSIKNNGFEEKFQICFTPITVKGSPRSSVKSSKQNTKM